jgi:uncharacterized repeat protein (TIGR01451 family)
LTVTKANDAQIETIDLGDGVTAELPTVDEGASVTFTLAYDLLGDPVTDGWLEDVLPQGITYVSGSATSSAEFSFVGYDSATRTLTWTAPSVTVDGSLSYRASVDVGASELTQPLVNVAAIDSTQTEPDADESELYAQQVGGATAPPTITPPPTDELEGLRSAVGAGVAFLLTLVGLAVLALGVGSVTPLPAWIRERDRRRDRQA